MSAKLLTEAAHACLSLDLSKCQIVGNHMSRLIWCIIEAVYSHVAHTHLVCSLDDKSISVSCTVFHRRLVWMGSFMFDE